MAKITYVELNQQFVSDIRQIITSAREQAIRSVDSERVRMYWKLGERIFMEEQGGAERAEYGINLLQTLAIKLECREGYSSLDPKTSDHFGTDFPKNLDFARLWRYHSGEKF